jgi:ribose-phosphate pyrophosphokinase
VTPLVLATEGNRDVAATLARRLDAELGRTTLRRFPDGESYVRVESDVAGRDVVVACTLDRPDEKLVPLYLLAATARDLGARRIGLVAPYLAYLRQDRRFRPGEGVTSAYVARFVGTMVDWLVTVDPHLHRYASLGEVYGIPATAVHAAPLLAKWIRTHVPTALVVGPDRESTQWVAAVAADAGVPWTALDKVRRGDRDVDVTLTDVARWRDRTPVLVDDIVSTGASMVAAMRELGRHGLAPAVCLAVHAVLADGAEDALRRAGAARLVTCNTIRHPSNAIDVDPLVAAAVRESLGHA